MTQPRGTSDVLVVGGGMAGLVTARALAENGLSVCVLEARARSGGRVFTERVEGWPSPVELGAEFVHGKPHALLELANAAGARLENAEFAHFIQTPNGLQPLEQFWAHMTEVFEKYSAVPSDRPASDVLASSRVAPEHARMMALFVEGFHAADLQRVSARSVAMQM
ncbi:MAG TPA: FAD-dependent oxidoreductase, partial [Polyangiaceae bacterium]